MLTALVIVRYPRWLGWAGFLSMAVFRWPLALSGRVRFWKLLGCGRNGTFDIRPDWRQWAVLVVWNEEPATNAALPRFLRQWWRFFRCELCSFTMQALEGHGTWDKQACFGEYSGQAGHDGMIAVLTRATIRINRLRQFWGNVSRVTQQMQQADGFLFSAGIGEVPWIKQATFSIWQTKEAMKQFAYRSAEHADVIRKTRSNDWYSEEMFVRFRIVNIKGTLKGKSPLEGMA
ncbi:DUF3291 domain-containing protein [Sediminibacterium soli]|uniref:DUF3291 domain-containing protein n=1 Tax=Sediminibacterium soli TaxID=2698829 RepID=UPI001379894F|nr:DUF3291 domain-containing protein [Sediminibacterium soli]NCI46397.1 DUF3291 domain-containing protein [Sediminibacterium soli]